MWGLGILACLSTSEAFDSRGRTASVCSIDGRRVDSDHI